MRLNTREAVLGLLAVSVALFGGTALLAKPKFGLLKEVSLQQAQLREQIEQDRRLVGLREEIEKELAELSQRLPVQPLDKKMDIHWLSVMDNIAVKHGVHISKRQAGKEEKSGDLYELTIECKEWESNLDSMVHFLFDLQEEGAMLDVQQLLIKPKGGDVLRGRFLLNCAYTKQPAPATP